MQAAMKAVTEGDKMSNVRIRAAAAKFDIPHPTLHKHIIKGSATKLLGRFRRTFSNDQESELVCSLHYSTCQLPLIRLIIIFCLAIYSQCSLFVDQSLTWISHCNLQKTFENVFIR